MTEWNIFIVFSVLCSDITVSWNNFFYGRSSSRGLTKLTKQFFTMIKFLGPVLKY